MKELDPKSEESGDLLHETFRFWFADRDHIRSPFPKYIRHKLEQEASEKFYEWADNIPDEAKKELNDAMIAEKLEEVMFALAMDMVITEDERLTLRYPFLPRIGDSVNDQKSAEPEHGSVVRSRTQVNEDDHNFLKLELERESDGHRWETKIELPPS